MKKLSKFLIFLLLINSFMILKSKAQYADLYKKYSFNYESKNLNYRLLEPFDLNEKYHFENVLNQNLLVPIDKAEKYPLILFMHGAGERGLENERQLIHIDSIFAKTDFQAKYPCFVLAPQCPELQRWCEVDWSLDSHILPEQISEPLYLTNLLIDSLLKIYPIDEKRIYVIGLSMGGFGTWDLISRFPNKFAAAVPICGGGDENYANTIKNIPIWAFHGLKDKAVKVSRSQNMIAAIKKGGGSAKYTEYPNLGHLCWNKAFTTPELYEWMFAQKLK